MPISGYFETRYIIYTYIRSEFLKPELSQMFYFNVFCSVGDLALNGVDWSNLFQNMISDMSLWTL
jgi:hypothetical protein